MSANDRPIQRLRRAVPALLLCAAVTASGCRVRWGGVRVDPDLALGARLALQREAERDFPVFDERSPEPVAEEGGSLGEVILGELIAIFPGVLIHGLGHLYAGDTKTAGQLFRVGGLGYLLMGAGTGLIIGARAADDADQKGLAYSLYGSGGFVGAAGALFFFTAWGYDLIDTPRAVRSGGKPPPRSEFVESLDIFGDD